MNVKVKNTNPIKVIILDESQLYRKAVKRYLENDLQFKIIANSSNGDSLIQMSNIPNADVIIMDIQIPNLLNIYAVKEWVKLFPSTKIIAVTKYYDNVILKFLENVGFKGCIKKSDLTTQIKPALQSVLRGGYFFKEYNN